MTVCVDPADLEQSIVASGHFGAMSAAELSWHDQAVIMPLRRGRKTNKAWDAGVFTADGTPIPHAHLHLHKLRSGPLPHVFAEADKSAEDLSGKWLFAGVMPRKTGHILLNALGRVWALDALGPNVGLLFVPHLYGEPEHPFLTSLLRTLGEERPIKLVTAPTRVEQLVVGPDGFSSFHLGAAHPRVVDWLRQRANPKRSRRGRRKLYITRSKLSPLVGRYLCEDILEENLAAAGYEIVVPEALSLKEQFDLYSQAQEVIAAEGTAVHIIALALPNTARLTVIQRREDVPDLIENQLRCFLPTPPVYLNAVAAMHWPEQRAVNIALTTLDFERLRDGLVAHDLITAKDPWRVPTRAEVTQSMGQGRAEGARFLTFDERQEFLREFRRRRKERRK